MKKYLILMALFLYSGAMTASFATDKYIGNRYPLVKTQYMEMPLGSIKADGWLLEQLKRQKSGLTGHLDEVYPQVVGERNAWLGGDGDAWERGPYWIDGLLPLAYILDDRELKDKAQVWVEAILGSQKEDGYFGPDIDRSPEPGLQRDNSHDWWPKMVALKILKQYYMATRDERVIPFLTNYFRYQLKMLPQYPLGHWTFWGAQRGGDNLDVVYWLYNITGEKFLLDLGEIIHAQSEKWTDIFLNDDHLYRQNSIHCVNLGQGFKEPVIYYQQSGDRKYVEAVEKAAATIRTTIGLPTGLWAGDELLHYGDPTRGSELCTAVEMMFSLENILRITGDMKWADYLERVAYNALPTQADDDYATRQYFQQTNQIKCDRTLRPFSTAHKDTDQVFGILNGYPCCTTNMHQGWPKFVQNLWYATSDEGVAALVYAPSEVDATVAGGVEVNIKEDTFYPFDNTAAFSFRFKDKKVKKAYFPFHLRIPQWCKDARVKVNGHPSDIELIPGEVAVIRREWSSGDVLSLELPMEITSGRWYDNAAVVERGPLVFALRMNENWTRKEFDESEHVTYGKWYYQVTSDSRWNYALIESFLEDNVINEKFKVTISGQKGDYPWNLENAPVSIRTTACVVNGWEEYRGSTGAVAYRSQSSFDVGETVEIELIPYGCTTLRISEFPVRSVKVSE